MSRVVAALLLLTVLLPAPAALAADCRFVGGFATLHDLAPDIVGDCTEDEHHDPATGDAQQATTRGLLAWRKADNWTAFTDGATTWINGPEGLQSRANDQRFAWEAAPPAPPEYAALRGFTFPALVPPAGLQPFASLPITSIDSDQVHMYRVTYGDALDGPARIEGTGGMSDWSAFVQDDPDLCDPSALYCAYTGLAGGGPTTELFRGLHVSRWDAAAEHLACCNGNRWWLMWYDRDQAISYRLELQYEVSYPYGQAISAANLTGAQALARLAEQLVPVT